MPYFCNIRKTKCGIVGSIVVDNQLDDAHKNNEEQMKKIQVGQTYRLWPTLCVEKQ